uniref:Dystrophin n=1 Tax=Strigamia maritima TaxID=126957 RepID=T1J1M8_STRMM
KILDGWEKKRTENDVPYYLCHVTQCSQWEHPLLNTVMEELSDYKIVKYSTYRLALKLRALQNVFKLHLVSTEILVKIYNQVAVKPVISESTMSCTELELFLYDVFNIARVEQNSLTDPRVSAELCLNFLINLFDSTRSGVINVFSVFVGLLIFSMGKLHEKYKFLFRILANHNNCMTKNSLTFLLNILAEIPERLNEKITFGKTFVAAAVESCFSNKSSPLGITEEMFLSWLLQEPQTVVWISTFFRLVTAESVLHAVKCCVCKMYPITGLRYRCLYCFSYDLCQHCFLTGQISKKHKLKHPIQEYCTTATSKEDRKVMMKRLGNKLKMKKNKQSFLPIRPTQTIPEVDVFENQHATIPDIPATPIVTHKTVTPGQEFLSCTILNGMPMKTFLASQQNELESVIIHLEQQQKLLRNELDQLDQLDQQDLSLSSSSDDAKSTASCHSTVSRQEVLLDHEKQLELQLRRLKRILKSFNKMCKNADQVNSVENDDEMPFAATSTPNYVSVEVHNQPMDREMPSPIVTNDFLRENRNISNGLQTDSTRELNQIQDELDSIMKHLELTFPDNKQTKDGAQSESDDLLKAAIDVSDILADLVDKVRINRTTQ